MSYWWICAQCAGSNGGKMPEGHLATFHNDFCSWCGEFKPVTEPRDWGYPINGPGISDPRMTATSDFDEAMLARDFMNRGWKAGRASRDGLRDALELFKPLIEEDRFGMISDEYRKVIEAFDKALAEDEKGK